MVFDETSSFSKDEAVVFKSTYFYGYAGRLCMKNIHTNIFFPDCMKD